MVVLSSSSQDVGKKHGRGWEQKTRVWSVLDVKYGVGVRGFNGFSSLKAQLHMTSHDRASYMCIMWHALVHGFKLRKGAKLLTHCA